jgi:hypothetical protein
MWAWHAADRLSCADKLQCAVKDFESGNQEARKESREAAAVNSTDRQVGEMRTRRATEVRRIGTNFS